LAEARERYSLVSRNSTKLVLYKARQSVYLFRMRHVTLICSLLLALSCASLFGQHAVDPAQRYHRLICLVHFTGSGQNGDPVRPEYVPGPADARSRAGIVAWSAQPTDDGKMAIVQVVAVDRNAFAAILADTRPEVKVFEIGKDSQQAIEAFMQMHKANFSLDAFRLVAQ
jgi:hypothetical protein